MKGIFDTNVRTLASSILHMLGIIIACYSSKVWSKAGAQNIVIYGLGPVLEEQIKVLEQTPREIGDFADNPIFGRQTCPSLTRLNLVHQKSEPLLLASLVERKDDQIVWRFQKKAGLYWWSGTEVTLDHMVEFMQNFLPLAVQHVGGGLWKVPEFKVEKKEPDIFEVHWSQDPAFGPFVLNGIPLAREPKKEGISEGIKKFECVGLYRPEVLDGRVKLLASPGYKSQKPMPEIEAFASQTSSEGLHDGSIKMLVSGVWNRKEGSQCTIETDEPMVTALLWNQSLGVVQDAELRQLLDQLIPRETLADVIGRRYVMPADSILLRGLPRKVQQLSEIDAKKEAVDEVLKGKKSQIEKIASKIQQLGYARPDPKGPRLDLSGKPIELLMLSRSQQFGIIEKVIEDVFSSVGIKVRILVNSDSNGVAMSDYHAVISTFRVDWPGSNLLSSLHSQIINKGIFKAFKSTPTLDAALEKYARSLTYTQPDFLILDEIESEMRKITGISVLLQHRMCLSIGNRGMQPGSKNVQLGPDWFRNILLTL